MSTSRVRLDPARTRAGVARLLRPKSIALIGASPTPGSLGAGVLGNLTRFGYAGDLYLINPNRSEIDGRPCLKSAMDLPEGVDCAIIAVPQAAVLDAVRACAARGVGGAVIFGAGFAEQGEAGKALQDELARIAADAGMAVEGPNCLGYVNYVDGVATTFGAMAPFPVNGRRAVGIVSQSGAMATVLRAALQAHDVPVSLYASTGNEALNGLEDFLEFIVEDPATHVVTLVAEQFRDPQRFLALSRRCAELGKPMALLHPGRSAAAREAAQTHTGAMSGDWDVMRALTEREGVCVVETLDELIDVSEFFIRYPQPVTGGVAIISDSGAFKGMAFDFCQTLGLDLPEPAPHTRDVLGAIAPNLIQPTNPLDLTAQALVDPQLYRKTLEPFLHDDGVGSVLFGGILSSPLVAPRKMQPIIDAARELKLTKPVIFGMLGDDAEIPQDIITTLRSLNVAFFRSPERALRALAAFTRHHNRRKLPASAPVAPAPRLPSGVIAEHEAKKLLAAAGVPVPRSALAVTREEAQALAAQIGFPVVLKAQAAALAHKSDAGGVVLDLADADAVARGWDEMHASVARARPGLALDGVLVEQMSKRGVELIFGARNDPQWGAVLVVGLGGVLAEALHDVRVLAPDLDAASVADELRRLKGAALLGAFRGQPARDVEAAAQIAVRLGAFVMAHPEIAEIDVNPVIVYAQGEGAVALDALIVAR
ncbi:MAG: CoA-binding protein [Hyphomicrobiales bacterium]|nr:CoA-binding protein [Hyphomicrobiales bacterium]